MRDVSGLRRDREGLTAVIEFLSAFTLFLMILTAFLALAQMQMGSNDPYLDRLDRSAVLGLDRLVADEGWYVPVVDGEADVANGTSAWHEETAAALEEGRVRAGLVVTASLMKIVWPRSARSQNRPLRQVWAWTPPLMCTFVSMCWTAMVRRNPRSLMAARRESVRKHRAVRRAWWSVTVLCTVFHWKSTTAGVPRPSSR